MPTQVDEKALLELVVSSESRIDTIDMRHEFTQYR